MDDLERFLMHLEGGRVAAITQAPSPFSNAMIEAQLSARYRNMMNDLCFHGNMDPFEF